MRKILQKESPVLREISKNIPLDSIKFPKIQKIIKEMQVALASQDDGVAIAASQIGYPLRIFVVSKRVEDIMKKEKKQAETSEKSKDLIFINPTLKKVSK